MCEIESKLQSGFNLVIDPGIPSCQCVAGYELEQAALPP